MSIADVFVFALQPLRDMFSYAVHQQGALSMFSAYYFGFFAVGIIAGAWRLVLNLAKYRGE